MDFLRMTVPVAALLILAGCSSGDPRLPQKLYEEATQLMQQGRNQEAQGILTRLSTQFPDTLSGQNATKDLYTLEGLLRQEFREKQKALHSNMKRVADALTRYKGNHGEYPRFLSFLVPEYLDQAPETPWKHPYLFRPYVTTPILDTKDRKGRMAQVFSTKLDGYILVSLGVDMQVGGEGLAEDTYIVNGEWYKGSAPPSIPMPQPLR